VGEVSFDGFMLQFRSSEARLTVFPDGGRLFTKWTILPWRAACTPGLSEVEPSQKFLTIEPLAKVLFTTKDEKDQGPLFPCRKNLHNAKPLNYYETG
jgi:hypothetical protein